MYSIIYTGKKFVGAGNGVFVSDDTISWNQTYPGNDLAYNFSSIAWSGYSYVAVGNFPYQSFFSPY
ncbi:MAG TPA: hypothetical protein DIC22_07660 [Chitinophagaceae bacterium]|nr:hypothetical protein [Chitinophagaceae bacterium]